MIYPLDQKDTNMVSYPNDAPVLQADPEHMADTRSSGLNPSRRPPLKVLYVSTEGRMAGAERSLLLLLKHLDSKVRAILACPAGSDLWNRCRQLGVQCHDLPPLFESGTSSKLRLVKVSLRLLRIIKGIRPDIVHANNLHAAIVCQLAAAMCSTPLIWHARDFPFPHRRWLWKVCSAGSNRIIAISHAVEGWLADLGVAPGKIDVVHNGIDAFDFGPAAQRPPREGFIFANVGQMVAWKNQGLFLDAARRVHQEVPQAVFWVIGSNVMGRKDGCEEPLRRKIETCGMSSYVELMNWRDSMDDLWPRIDCLVHTASHEPFGRVVIEAMAAGRPVVAFDSGGPSEIVAHGRTGMLVPSGSVDALCGAMVRLAHDPQQARLLGQEGRRVVTSMFTAEATAKGVLETYQRLFGSCQSITSD